MPIRTASRSQIGVQRCPLVALPILLAAERQSVSASPDHEAGRGGRYPGYLQCARPSPGLNPAAQDCRQVCPERFQTCRLAGRQHSGRFDRFFLSGRSPPKDPQRQQSGASMPGNPKTYQGSSHLPQ